MVVLSYRIWQQAGHLMASWVPSRCCGALHVPCQCGIQSKSELVTECLNGEQP
jgi:hypothetical protein